MRSRSSSASGDPKAAVVLQALQDGRLLYSAEAKKVFIKDAADKLTDAETGAAGRGAPPDDADAVRLNNRLRGMLEGMLGSSDADVARCRQAAATPRNPSSSRATPAALPALEKALEAEKNARVKQAMTEARAAIICR